MAQPLLNQSKIDSGLKQVRSPRMAKRVNRCLLVDAALFEGGVECILNRAFVDWLS